MTANPQQRPPKGLLRAGRALWREVQSQYVLDPAEGAVLLQMCRLSDQLAQLQEEFSAENVTTVQGSRGQPVLNPILAEIRLTSLALAKLAAELDLPQPKSPGAANRRGRLQSVDGLTRRAGA
jgi:hypothetical protein